MQHFYTDDNLNVFRLPVGWQYLVPSPGDDLNATSIASYDILMQGCLDTGALCILDVCCLQYSPETATHSIFQFNPQKYLEIMKLTVT